MDKEPKKLVKKPRIMVIGKGGRENVIVWKLAKSPLKPKIYCVPGNPGIRKYAECIKADITNIENLYTLAKDKRIDMVIVGPELPLSLGIVDFFEKHKIKVFGPNKKCSQLESSKIFAKQFMTKYNIPTARYRKFSDLEKAQEFISDKSRFVIKVDGLAAGKGVFVCDNIEEGIEALEIIFIDKAFGSYGDSIIVEELLEGTELSFMVFTDGETILPMESSQDHKKIWNRDDGPNTGGMGSYSPVPFMTKELEDKILQYVMIPAINGIYKETGTKYKGVLYAGLMLDNYNNIKVLEFNVRFGDPEAQVILTRLETDLVKIINSCLNETLDNIELEWSNKSSVCVIAVSGGYPFEYETNFEIKGLGSINSEDIEIFHAGTDMCDMKLVTDGGRVLGVNALGDTLSEAITNAYMAISNIYFDGIFYRDDIGLKGLGYEK